MNGISTAGPTCENRISGSPNSASSAAMVRSQNIASSQPPPSAWPCTEAITGFFSVHGVIRQRMLDRQPLAIFQRVVPPRPLVACPAADVEADAEAAPFRPQHDDAGGLVGVGAQEHRLDREPHLHASAR